MQPFRAMLVFEMWQRREFYIEFENNLDMEF